MLSNNSQLQVHYLLMVFLSKYFLGKLKIVSKIFTKQ